MKKFILKFLYELKNKSKKTYSDEYYKIYKNRFKGLTQEEIAFCLKEQFKVNLGYKLNLDNPKTFNEKMTWEKLYYHNPLMTICADKVKARDYYCEKIKNGNNNLVKQFGVYDNFEQINFDNLPNKFVLKSNWGSGKQIIVKNKDDIDLENVKKEVTLWNKKETNHYFYAFEWGYKNIDPKIICEEFLDFEYKLEFFCFNGEPKLFWIVLNDKTKNVQANFYDLNFKKIKLRNHYPNFNKTIREPECYKEVLGEAKRLCGDFPFVRCDFYITKDSYRFSEMTFFHWGCSKKYQPMKWDNKLGNFMKLPDEKIIETI